jgi:outer membrane protein
MGFLTAKRSVVCWALTLLTIALASPARPAEPELSLPDAVRQAISSNLDLIAQRQALAADRAEIGLARSALLPQVDVGERGQSLDNDRSDGARGNNVKNSFLVAGKLTQILYDEDSWAGFDIQKRVYEGQVQELEAFQLSVIQDAADAYLELDRAQQVLDIQQRNRKLTRENIEKSRARIAAGWSSEQDILRWESQLASNDASVRAAQVLVLQNRLELNRVRNQPPEDPVATLPATLQEYGFAYARQSIGKAIVTPERDQRMRDFLVRVGVRRSPDLAALGAAIEAAERQLTANRRAFWVPTLSLNAGVDYLTNSGSGDDFNETEWGVQGLLTFPLFRGGAKFANLEQAREGLASLRSERKATALTLDESIRAALAQSSGSFETIGFAERGVAAALRNYELVSASYTLGVDSILDLLDAQQQLLAGELSHVNALYTFLESVIAVERQISLYPFLEDPAEVDALYRQLEQQLTTPP